MDKDLLRFYSHIIDYSDETVCWEWDNPGGNGYGKFKYKGKNYIAHRWIYEYYVGIILPGYVIDHKCNNKLCVNLWHLEAVTPRENVRRSVNARGPARICKRGHLRIKENLYTAGACKECIRIRAEERQREKLSN